MAPASDIFDWSAADLYMIMGVSRDADAETIRKAFRRMAKLHHPDRYPLDAPERVVAASRFKALAEAHAVLSDPAQREAYDAELRLQELVRPGTMAFDFPIPPPAPPAEPEGAAAPPPVPQGPRMSFDPFADETSDDEGAGASFAEALGDQGQNQRGQRHGTSDASRKSAATAYYTQGMRYYGYGEYDRAMRCFLTAMQLDPTRKVSPHVWAKLQRYAYGFD